MNKLLVCLVSALLVLGACGGDEEPEPEAAAETPQAEETETPQAGEDTSAYPPEQVAVLEDALLVAYEGAAEYAVSNDNYFAQTPKETGELAAAVSTALSGMSAGVGSAYVEEDQLDLCSRYPDAPMVWINTSEDGDDLILAAADNEITLRLTYEVGSEPTFGEPTECGS